MQRLYTTLFVVSFVSLTTLSAQLGLTTSLHMTESSQGIVDEAFDESFGNGYEVALDYWFQLNNRRIEFRPTLAFGRYAGNSYLADITLPSVPSELNFKADEFSFQFRTNLYLLDLRNDCHCSTFANLSSFFRKGWFIQVAPGLSLVNAEVVGSIDRESLNIKTNAAFFTLELTTGLDFGITDWLTISPQAGYRHYFGDPDWTEANALAVTPFQTRDGQGTHRLNNVNVGLRLGINMK